MGLKEEVEEAVRFEEALLTINSFIADAPGKEELEKEVRKIAKCTVYSYADVAEEIAKEMMKGLSIEEAAHALKVGKDKQQL